MDDATRRDRAIRARPKTGASTKPRKSGTDWIKEYVADERIRAADVDLRLLGVGVLGSLRLKDIYTPLKGKIGSDSMAPRPGGTDLDSILATTPALLLVGESGSGKSTYLSHACERYLEEQSAFPFFLALEDLNHLTAEILGPTKKLLWNTLLVCLNQRLEDAGITVGKTALEEFVKSHDVVWLLDGLNEITDFSIRRQLGDVIKTLQNKWPQSRYVITATDAVIRDGTAPPTGAGGFEYVVVAGFEPEDIGMFFDSFIKARDPAATEDARRARWEPVHRRLLGSPELRELAASPLYLMAIAVVYLSEPQDPMTRESLPSSRVDLLDAVTRWMIEKRKAELENVEGPRDIRAAFAKLAFSMMTDVRGPLNRIGLRRAAEIIADCAGLDGDVNCSEKFLNHVAELGGIFFKLAPGDLSIHSTMRDYLVSEHLVGVQGKESWRTILGGHLEDPSWRLVIRMVPGHLIKHGTDRANEFFRWLAECSIDLDEEVRLARVALGGIILRDLRPAGYSWSAVDEWLALVKTVGQIFEDPLTKPALSIRYEAAAAFGLEGDERLLDENSLWVPVSASESLLGVQNVNPLDRNYVNDPAGWELPLHPCSLTEFSVRRFPVTVGEFAPFVGDGYSSQAEKLWDEIGWRWREGSKIDCPLDWEQQMLLPNTPVTGVSWFEARAFCEWLTQTRIGHTYRLPLECEWERVATLDSDCRTHFPWGNTMQWGDVAEANWAGAQLRRKSPVGMFPTSTTTQGIADLFGNVEEWCLEEWRRQVPDHVANRGPVDNGVKRVVRGGSCIRFSRLCRPTYRSQVIQENRYHTVGFRPIRIPL